MEQDYKAQMRELEKTAREGVVLDQNMLNRVFVQDLLDEIASIVPTTEKTVIEIGKTGLGLVPFLGYILALAESSNSLAELIEFKHSWLAFTLSIKRTTKTNEY